MSDNKKQAPHVTVTFNGKKHNLDEWTRKETAADKDKSLDWNTAFSTELKSVDEHAHAPSHLLTDQDAFVKRKHSLFRGKRIWRPKQHQISGAVRIIRFFWLPAAAAVVVGLVIGLSMLTIFSQQNHAVKDTWANSGKSPQTEEKSQAIQNQDLNLSVYLIQAGLFGSKSKADQIASQLRNHGPSILMATPGGTAIFVGVAETDAGASQLLTRDKDQGLTVFKKQMQFQPATGFLNNKKQANSALDGKKLMLAFLAASEESQNGASSPSKKTMQNMDRLYEKCRTNAASTNDNTVGRFLASVDQSKNAAQKLAASHSEAQFVQFQQSLLESVSEYGVMINSTNGKK